MVGLWLSAEASWYRAQLELLLRGGSAWGSHPTQWWSTDTSGLWLLSLPKAASIPQQHQGLCPCNHVSVGTAGTMVSGRASLSSPGQLWLLVVQSSPGHVRVGAGGLQTQSRGWHSPGRGSIQAFRRDISAGQGFDMASSS